MSSEKKSVGKEVAKHSIIYGLGDILRKTVGFLLIPFYTTYLSSVQYGQLEVLDLTSYLISTFLTLGLMQAIIPLYYSASTQEAKDQTISNAFIAAGVSGAVFVLIASPFARQISSLVLNTPEHGTWMIIVFCSMYFGMFSELGMILIRIEERSLLYTLLSLIRLVLSLGLNIYFIAYLKQGVGGVLLGALIVSNIFCVYSCGYVLKRIKFSFNWNHLKVMVVFSAPLIINWFSMFITNFADRFFLQKMGFESELGVYSLAYKFGMLPNFLILEPFMRSWTVKRFQIAQDADSGKTMGRVFTAFIYGEVFICIGIGALISDAVRIMSGQEFHLASNYVLALLLSYLMYGVYNFAQFGLLFRKKTSHIGFIGVITAIINIAANYFLVQRYGAWGATIATLLSFTFISVATVIVSQRFFQTEYEYLRLFKLVAVGVVVYGLSKLISFTPESFGGDVSIVNWANVFTKGFIASCYPVLLWFSGFYTEAEIRGLREWSKKAYLRMRGRVFEDAV